MESAGRDDDGRIEPWDVGVGVLEGSRERCYAFAKRGMVALDRIE
jgi:hypothetical protein